MAGITIGELVAHLDLQDAGWRKGMTDAQKQLVAFDGQLKAAAQPVQQFGTRIATAGNTARVSINKLQGSLLVLASSASGVHPAIARIATVLSGFSVGGKVTAAVLAGTAALGYGWKRMTTGLKEMEEQAKKSLDELVKLGKEAKNQASAGFRVQRVQAEIARGDLRQQQSSLLSRAGVTHAGGLNARDRREFDLLAAQMLALDNVVERSTAGLEELAREAAEAADKIVTLAERVTGVGIGERADILAAQAQRQAVGVRQEARAKFMAALPKTTTISMSSSPGALATPINKFNEAVKSFGNGVKQMVQGAFSADGLSQIGANLASGAIGFAAGKLMGVVTDFLDGVDHVAKALERNTAALTVRAEVLAERLRERGLDDEARKLPEVIRDVLEGAILGEPLIIEEELRKVGLTLKDFRGIAAALGINLGNLNPDILQQFLQQVDTAVGELDSLGDEARRTAEALKNLPEGFKIGARIFEAIGPASGGGGGTPSGNPREDDPWWGGVVTVNNYINAQTMTPDELLAAAERQAARAGSRGRPVALPRGMSSR